MTGFAPFQALIFAALGVLIFFAACSLATKIALLDFGSASPKSATSPRHFSEHGHARDRGGLSQPRCTDRLTYRLNKSAILSARTSLTEKNLTGALAMASLKLDFFDYDRADPDELNRILWAEARRIHACAKMRAYICIERDPA